MADSALYWYKKAKPHSDIFAYVKELENKQSNISTANLRHMRLYGNSEFASYSGFGAARIESTANIQNRVTLNVVQSMVDTAHSKITKNKPRPYFLTDGGNWTLKRRAQKLTQFVDGAFYHTEFYSKLSDSFRQACVLGTGGLKFFIRDNDLCVENVFIDELVVDQNDAIYGSPRQLHQKKYVNREVLAAMFPSFKADIEFAVASLSELGKDIEQQSHMVLVVESWKLPSKKGAKDGKHVICVNNKTLFEEKYEDDFFPFVFPRWNKRLLGFFGEGIAEQLTGIQLEINKILRTIQISMHLVSVPKIFVEASSKIITSHLNNKIGGIIKYAGTPPTEGKLGTVPAELFSHLDRLYQRAYSIIGISQMAAQAQKPQGLNSGKALRTFNDIESERFTSVGRMYEDCALQGAKILISLVKKIAAETGNYSVKAPGSQFLSTIEWSEVEMDETDYIMQCFPVSALSNDPASRMQEVQELVQSGFIDKTIGTKLLDYPDLRAYYDSANAAVDDIERQIELIVDKQNYQSPEPYQNLIYGIPAFQSAYLMYKAQGAPEDILDLLRRWIDEASDLLQKASQPAIDEASAAAAAEAAPTAAPEAPPTSDLISNVPMAG